MKISDVLRETGLTRKAIYYYEENGLLQPVKNHENSYRDYSEYDVNRLKQIKLLRRLDIPLNQIKDLLNHPHDFRKVMGQQLEVIKEKRNVLNEIEKMISILMNENNKSSSFFEKLDRLNDYLELDARSKMDYMKKELERIFPSDFGKLMVVMYGAFLDEPIDNKEKEVAWAELVHCLDSTEQIHFPDEIARILNTLYEQVTKDGMKSFEDQYKKAVDKVISFTGNFSDEEKKNIYKKMQESKNHEGEYKEQREMMTKLLEYIKDHQNILPTDIPQYLKILSSKYTAFTENLLKTIKSLNTIGKNHGL